MSASEVGAPPYGRRVVQRVVLVNVAEPIEFPGALLKGSRQRYAVLASSAFMTSPTDQSISSMTSPNNPAALFPLNFADTAIGTCGIE